MAWYKTLANILDKCGRTFVIYDRECQEPYLVRYYLINTRWLPKWLNFLSYNVVIHCFWKSDDDGGLHDHPWRWKSKLLEGSYYEHVPAGKYLRKAGDPWRSGTAKDLHRVELLEEGSKTWTLFIMGSKEREWGFIPNGTDEWVQWEEYLARFRGI